jgi:hypothetical protein
MNNEKKIPDAETRAKSIACWREVNLMLEDLNMKLAQAELLVGIDLQNSHFTSATGEESDSS